MSDINTLRQAAPVRVQQIWDGISRFNANQLLDFEKLVEVVNNVHKVPKVEINQELNYAIKDKLVATMAVETQRREETEVYKLPKKEDFVKGDRDWYCFQCHTGGQVVKCEDCTRVFHLDCLPEDRKPDKDLFVCPPCHIISTKPSAEKVSVKPKHLNQMIEYVCERFISWNTPWLMEANGKSWAQASVRSDKEAWRFNMLVYNQMDLNTMMDKAQSGKYQSLEEFQVDCETLVHSVGVYFGPEYLKGTSITAQFHKEVLHDISEIKLCHECFRRSNEKNDEWWFCLPCNPQHDVVWAKQTGYPFWPAKVMKKDGTKYDVRYFGGNYERGIIDNKNNKNILSIETPIAQLKVRKTVLWNEAYDELTKFLEIAKNPEAVESLPARHKGTPASAKKASKRANTSVEETPVAKKPRKSVPSATPKSVSKTSVKESPKANGTPSVTPSKKKSAVKPVSNRRESSQNKSSLGSQNRGKRLSVKDNEEELTEILDDLDPDIRNIALETDRESLNGSVYFSDDESVEAADKVSEDTVSSSCNESKSTRNVYVQVNRPGAKELNLEKLSTYIADLKERHKLEISQNKKKQWCYNCEKEAIYHCCWNTAYCSIECQQQHWAKEHKRLCRRKKAA